MKRRILASLRDTRPVADASAAALAAWPADMVRAIFGEPLVPAAVLLPLVDRPEGLTVVLTRRTEHLRDHPGQISFPGGRLETHDDSPASAALREAAEEIGIVPGDVELAGYLAPHAVVTGFVVTPVVGFLPGSTGFRPDPFEVAEVFEVPLDFFLAPSSRQSDVREVGGVQVPVCAWHYQQHRIWGATAQIIDSFIKVIYNK